MGAKQNKNNQKRQQKYLQQQQSQQLRNLEIPPQQGEHVGKKVLVLDLDETLVHSQFKEAKSDFILQIVVQGIDFTVYVSKRPGCEDFLDYLAQFYEIFIYTASLKEYADPVIDLIDRNNVVSQRLYRQHCTLYNNVFVKDMTQINRNIGDIILVDNSEASFLFQPENALHIKDYFDDDNDLQLYRMMPFLEFLSYTEDVRYVMRWLQIFERSEECIVYIDMNQEQREYDKVQAIEQFEEIFPFKYMPQQYYQQDEGQQSYDSPPMTNRGKQGEQQEEEDEDQEIDGEQYQDIEDDLNEDLGDEALESHKGMLNKKQSLSEQLEERKKQEQQKKNSKKVGNHKKNAQSISKLLVPSASTSRKEKKKKNNNYYSRDEYSPEKDYFQDYNNDDDQYGKQQGKKRGSQKKKSFQKPGLTIDIEEDQVIDQNVQESTKNFLGKENGHNNHSSNGLFKSNKQFVKSKEYEDHSMFSGKKGKISDEFANILKTQPMEIQENEMDIIKAKQQLFGQDRFDPSVRNFNSPVARNNYIQFLSKKKIDSQQSQQQQKKQENDYQLQDEEDEEE